MIILCMAFSLVACGEPDDSGSGGGSGGGGGGSGIETPGGDGGSGDGGSSGEGGSGSGSGESGSGDTGSGDSGSGDSGSSSGTLTESDGNHYLVFINEDGEEILLFVTEDDTYEELLHYFPIVPEKEGYEGKWVIKNPEGATDLWNEEKERLEVNLEYTPES